MPLTSKIKALVVNNRKIIENYFFITALQISNSLFYLLIYPFLISALGAENYGEYVFAMSVVSFLMTFVSFGFDFPAVKAIAQNTNDQQLKSEVLSKVFTAKVYLESIALGFFAILVAFVPVMRENWLLLVLCFPNTLTNIIFPNWYYQGMQKMRIVTYIQLGFKVLSLPLIFWLVANPGDAWIFALISTLSNVAGGVVAAAMVRFKEGLQIRWVAFAELKEWFKDALPFFWSTAAAAIKYQSISIIAGSFFKMSDVALYDLAYKIISIPNIVFGSINGALFPKMAVENNPATIRKVLKLETIAGLLVVAAVVLFGEWVILFLSGPEMLNAYPLAVMMSFGVLTFLLVGAYISFIFVPQNQYKLVSQNQFVAFGLYFLIVALGLLLWKHIMVLAIAWTFAQLFEILYCNLLIRRYKLLPSSST